MTTCAFRSQTDGGEDRMFYEDRVILVDPEFFRLFSFPFVHGRAENALLNPDAVVLAETTAAKYFGRENPVGQKLTLNNRRDKTVSAVVRIPPRSSIQFDVLAPLSDRMSQNWNWSDPSYLLLNQEADLDAFREKIAGTMERHAPYPDAGRFRTEILPLERAHLEFGRRAYVQLFSLIAGFILLLACINYMNLATASAGLRAREVGLRKVVGAARPQLILQFLSESVLTAAAALIPAILLVYVGLPWINRLTGKQLVLPLFSAPGTFPELLALVVLVGAAAGLYPALFLSARRPVSILKSGLSTGSSRSPLRVAAVVGQFSLSVLLIAAALGAERQIQFIRNRPLGLSTRSVLQLRLNPQLLARFQTFKRELLRNPRVLSVTAGQSVPYAEDYKTGGLDWDGKPEGFNAFVRYSIAHFDYFKTFDIQLAEGRSFSEENPTDRNQYLINQAAARYMGMEEPLGQRLEFWNREGQIIGVVRDYHHVSLHREILPQIFTINPVLYNALRLVFIRITPAEIPNTLEFIQDTTRRFAPGFPVEAVFLDEGTASLYENERRVGRLFSGFALLAVLISGLGIFGLSAFIAGQRTKEIGVRKILGASEAGIVGLLSRNFARWALLANLIAWPLAYFSLHRMLQSYAYRAKITIDLFLAAGLISLAAAAIPGAYHALKAARTDPVRSLRYE
jgi:putative ABC transport system permease protein